MRVAASHGDDTSRPSSSRSSSTDSSAPAPSSDDGAPTTVKRPAPAWDERIEPLARFVEEERGRPFKRSVPVTFLADGDFVDELGVDVEPLSDEDAEYYAAIDRALGWIGSDLDSEAAWTELVETGVAAFYEPGRRRIVDPRRAGRGRAHRRAARRPRARADARLAGPELRPRHPGRGHRDRPGVDVGGRRTRHARREPLRRHAAARGPGRVVRARAGPPDRAPRRPWRRGDVRAGSHRALPPRRAPGRRPRRARRHGGRRPPAGGASVLERAGHVRRGRGRGAGRHRRRPGRRARRGQLDGGAADRFVGRVHHARHAPRRPHRGRGIARLGRRVGDGLRGRGGRHLRQLGAGRR